ncbi:exopolysaccharide biosynthesis protein [Acidovorax sp. FG27]|uniref:exopolysaccharide biosynthesis protein n=1 Tax=Acidovorax sp. FG27 TaxID=3133652 RepID=UPI0030EAEC47
MLSALLASLIDEIERTPGDSVTLRTMIERSGREGMLLVCALATLPFLIPVSIPGVSTVFGAAIVLLAGALFMNRLPWLPRRVLDRPLDTARLVPVLRKGARLVGRIDHWVRPRWPAMTAGALRRLNCAAIVFGGLLLMAPLGPIPFSNTAPAVGILLLAVGLLQRDGLFVLLGYLGLVLSVAYFGVLGYLAWTGGTYLFG